jgi:hypothetical protein
MSNINTLNIDSGFPVAGQDNSSQGFRDNYTAIISQFQIAKDEISELQSNALLKAELTGLALSNDMQETELTNATLKNPGYTAVPSSSNTINVAIGSYFKVAALASGNTSTTITITSSAWPTTGIYSKIMVEVPCTTSTLTSINFAVTDQGDKNLYKEASLTLPYTASAIGSTLWELSTIDSGVTVFLRKVGGPFTVVAV